jgi:butyryl-CoA dehydrogenase
MDFSLSNEEKLLQNTIRDFAQKELAPIAERIDKNEEFPFSSIKRLGELGVTGLTISEEYGGSGGTFVQWCIAMEEIAYACAATASILDTSWGLACHCINTWGNEAQKKRYLPSLAKGENIAAFGLTEPNAGSDPAALETTAVKDGNSYVLNGSKIFISNGDVADCLVVFATRDKSLGYKGISTFIVEKGTPGFSVGSIYHKLGIRAASNAELLFEDCRIPTQNLLGSEGQGFRIALSILDEGRIGVAAIAVGIARAALEASIKHAKERKQYGQRIADFQAIQWMLADTATGIDAARLLTFRAANLKDKGLPFTTEAAMAKVFASEVAVAATTKAIQIHGGYGYMVDSPVQRYFRDAKITEIYEGTSEIIRLIIARSLLR